MPSLVIADYETIANVDRLCEVVGFDNKTKAVNAAVKAMLLARGVDVDGERRPATPADAALAGRLDGALRQATRDYVKLLEEDSGKPSGSRVYQMLSRRGPVDTVARIVMTGQSAGLELLIKKGKLELAFESIALSDEFRSLFDETTLRAAQKNLDDAERRMGE